MPWPGRPSMPAGGRVKAEDIKAQNDQTELLSSDECSLSSDHGGVLNSTTPVTTNLSRPVVANARYVARGFLNYTGSTTGDFKPSCSLPSGTTVHTAALLSGPSNVATPQIPESTYMGYNATLGALTAPGGGNTTPIVTYYIVVFTTGANAGNAVLTYAQAATDAGTATVLRAASTWWVKRVDAV